MMMEVKERERSEGVEEIIKEVEEMGEKGIGTCTQSDRNQNIDFACHQARLSIILVFVSAIR